MSQELCRLCLGIDNLKDIFLARADSEEHTHTTAVLASATGLRTGVQITRVDLSEPVKPKSDLATFPPTRGASKQHSFRVYLQIEPNDGLPQKICGVCTDAVNEALKLRNQCQSSETKLIQLGYQRRLQNEISLEDIGPKSSSDLENIHAVLESNEKMLQKTNVLEELQTDSVDFDGFKIEVELDRLTHGGHFGDDSEAKAEPVQPVKRNSRKEKRELYMSLVEGEYKPDAPVQCKVCKVTVSKWACFTNHVKKHLGFKFVCEFCGARFISSSQLLRHGRSLHGLQRSLQCSRPHCDYLALDNAQLQIHDRRVHTGARPFVCGTCGRAYHSRKCLLQHSETHREVATVQCPQCPLVLKSRRHLAKHRYGAHTDGRRKRRRNHKQAHARGDGDDAGDDRLQPP